MKKTPLFCLIVFTAFTSFSQKRIVKEIDEVYDYLNTSSPYYLDSFLYNYNTGMGSMSAFSPKFEASRGDSFYKYGFPVPDVQYASKDRFTSTQGAPFVVAGTSTKTYDSSANITELLENNYKSTYTYNANNGLVEEVERLYFNGSTWDFDQRINYSYDSQNRVVEKKTYFDFGQGIELWFHDSLFYTGNSMYCSTIKYLNPNINIKVVTNFINDVPQSYNTYTNGNWSSSGTYFTTNGKVDSIVTYPVYGGNQSANPQFAYYYDYNAAGKLTKDSMYNFNYNSILLNKYTYDADNYLIAIHNWRTNPINDTEIFNEKNIYYTYEDYLGITENTIEFACYPNPVQNELIVKTSEPIVSIAIYDLAGKIHLTQSGQQNIDVAKLPAGSYTVVVTTKSGTGANHFVKY